jgi:hypothetical protein
MQSGQWKEQVFSFHGKLAATRYKNREGKRATVPYHYGKILHPKVLSSIIRDANLTVEKFKELLK